MKTSGRSLALFIAFTLLSFRPHFLSAVEIKLGDVFVAAPDFRGGFDLQAGIFDPSTMQPALWKVDPVTGIREVVTSKDIGGGGALRSVTDVVVDRAGRITIADAYSHAVYRVDPATGFRTPIYDGSASPQDGPTLSTVSRLALGNDNSIFVADHREMSVIHIDPLTGARHLITGPNRGNGPSTPISNIAVGPTGDIWLTTYSSDADGYGVVRVDPATGDRTLVSGFGVGGGYQSIFDAEGFLLLGNNTALVSEGESIIQVDLVTGFRKVRVGYGAWSGASIGGLMGIAKGGSPSLFAVGEADDSLYRLDLGTQHAELLSGPGLPAGAAMLQPQQVYVYTPEPSSLATLFTVFVICGILGMARRKRLLSWLDARSTAGA